MIIFASASFAESSPFVFCLQALDSLMKCWHALMTGRELQHFSLQGYCLLISDCGHQHPVARTWNYHRQNTGHFEADSEEFLNTGKNGINIPLGFYTFLPYEADNPWWKAARSIWDRRCLQYLTEEIKNIIWSPEVFYLIPVFQPVCQVFTSVVSQWLQWKHFIKYEAYWEKEIAEWAKLCFFSRCHTPIPTLYKLLDTQRRRLVLNQCQKI